MVVGRRRVVLAVAGAVLVVGAVLAVGRAGDDGPAGSAEPEDAVHALFAAGGDGSCEAYAATTTEFFREDLYLGAATCEDFAAEAAEYATLRPVRVRVESVARIDVDTAQVEVVETYREGTPEEYRLGMAYRVTLTDDGWRVDHRDLTVLR